MWSDTSEILTAWIALSDVTDEDGPMRFVTGSQQWGLLGQGAADGNNFYGQELAAQRATLEQTLPSGAHWVEAAVTLPLGGVSFHDDFTIHGSGPNHGASLRRSLACHMRTGRSTLRNTAPGFAPGFSTLEPMPTELGYSGQPAGGDGGHEALCPVIFGQEAFAAQRRKETAAAKQTPKL
jgi:hypothetical protein